MLWENDFQEVLYVDSNLVFWKDNWEDRNNEIFSLHWTYQIYRQLM